MKPIVYRPEIEREVDKSMAHFEKEQTGLGIRFYRAYQAAIAKIQENPSTGFPADEGTRMLTISKFPYGIVFLEFDIHIQIIAVAHLHRRPGYWISRLEDES